MSVPGEPASSPAVNRRIEYEASQRDWLASYAVGEAQSGPRAFDEPEHSYRTCFQRDRDRIVHCSAFRRLDFKTQVFVPHEVDHFRTRLTHTLEVSQIARTLGRALRLNEDLLEAVALAHDLGHPPFGHAGEQALDKLMAGHGGFEHNRQSLRVVDYLEHPYPSFRGLNLTRVVRECLAKHETRYDEPLCEDFDPSLLAPLEGQLVDLADETAYTSADLEDALAAGWINVEQLSELELWRHAWEQAEDQSPQAGRFHKQIRAGKAVLAHMSDDVLTTTVAGIEDRRPSSPDDVRRAGNRTAVFSLEMSEAVGDMQTFLLKNVYEHPQSIAHHREAGSTIRDLFEAYVSDPSLLPQRYQKRIETDTIHRVACDYIAGMTDRFCKDQRRRLCG